MRPLQSDNNTDYSGLDELLNTEVLHNYNYSIVRKAVQSAKALDQVVDFGAGIGTLSLIFRERFGIEPLCVEIDGENKRYLEQRKLRCFDRLEDIAGSSDLIFSSNVLEHIEDDVAVLTRMRDALRAGGRIYLYVPAKMLLWSKMDEEVGHYRRYERDEIEQKCQQVGLRIVSLQYADSVGFFAFLLLKLIGMMPESGSESVRSHRFYDTWLFPISNLLDRLGFKYLCGKNLILVAEPSAAAPQS